MRSATRLIGLAAGPAVAILMLALPAPAGLSEPGWSTAAVAAWMAIWWMTEALPLAATALLPLILFPFLGVAGVGAAAAPFSNPVIFLFLGGFWIALAMERWALHRRIALAIVSRVGRRPDALIAGIMAATALLSMWVSNTATAMMMMPIALSAVADGGEPDGRDPRKTATMLAVAYAASIGGLGTLVGSPPNALVAGFLAQSYGYQVGFAAWMTFGVPLVLVMLPLGWLVLTRLAFRLPRAVGGDAAAAAPAGPITGPEKRLAAVVAAVALLWIANPLLAGLFGAGAVTDAGIAVLGAVLLFVIPSGRQPGEALLDWSWARRAPWDVLLLFGGGLSLAQAVDGTGLAGWIGTQLEAIAGWPPILLVLAVVALIVFLTELTSNTATASAFLPIVGALAVAAGMLPAALMVPAALAASCAFMLPVATPPNAIVFGSGHVTIAQMMRAGMWMNVVSIVLITAFAAAAIALAGS